MRLMAILLCGALAACSQTPSNQTTGRQLNAAQRNSDARIAARGTAAKADLSAQERCRQAVNKTQQQAANNAMLGSALSIAGGLGGFGGRGGALAAQALSTGGSIVQAQHRNKAQTEIEQECLS